MPRACLVTASLQNVFFEELMDAFQDALEEKGVATERAVDHFPPLEDDLVYVVVPHEYVPLTFPSAHPSEAQLRRTVVIATEQPGSPWFEESAAVAREAAVTLDINRLGVTELDRRGIPARLLQLGYVPSWDYWHKQGEPRPIDVTFLGVYTPRRALVVARCGRILQDRCAAIHLAENWRPHTAADRDFLSGERKFRHLAASKVLLSAHREANSYLEWPRLLGAAANGCVVLTEHSSAFAPLVPGEHFVSADFDNLPAALTLLLEDEDRLRSIRTDAYDFLRRELPLSQSIEVLAEAVQQARRSPVQATPARERSRPAPKPPPTREPEWRHVLAAPTDEDRLRAGIKQVLLAQQRLERRIDAMAGLEDDGLTIELVGPYEETSPRVTVALTLYNYAKVVEDALRSVALNTARDVELVLVDDASTDDSILVAERVIHEFPWLPAKVIRRHRNGGLPAARNLAVSEARGDYVFVLDADNLVYSHALGRLAGALDDDPGAAFAYGIIEKFDALGPTDLLSWLPWSAERFRYGNYIDAMAMIRRSALEEVGGFLTAMTDLGWEDFALWCAFAQRGMRGVRVPEILGRYRTSRTSMISSTNIDTSEAWTILVERFPFLLGDDAGRVKVG